MLTLGINTATSINSVTLFTKEEVIAEKIWKAEQNQAETLLPSIKEVLNKASKTWQDLTQILIVHGPGSFTSLRVGVITANALAYSLNIPQHAISTFEYYKKRLAQDATLILAAGKTRAYLEDEKIHELSEIDPKEKTFYGDVPEAFKENSISEEDLESFGEAFLKEDFSAYKSQKQVAPLYIQPAHITMSPKITVQQHNS